jgi:hypothetical protein
MSEGKYRWSLPKILVGAFFVMVVYRCTAENVQRSESPPPPPPTAADLQKEAKFQAIALIARSLKQAVKDPASFKLENVTAVGDAYCFAYRAKNSFNAVVPGVYVYVVGGFGSDKAADWNKHCANKMGEDFSYVRAVL